MYSCLTKSETDEERDRRLKVQEFKHNNKVIEKNINSEKKKKFSCLKLLLLGSGESGKSTILKQMKIIHIDGFSELEKIEFIPIIKRNVRDAIMALVVSLKTLHIEPKKICVTDTVKNLQKAFDVKYDYPFEYFDFVLTLWKDEDIQQCYSRSNEFQLIDSAKYFLDRLDVIRNVSYIPSLQDILRCRKMTNAITEVNFEVKDKKKNKVHFKVLDVGGQQGERKRWIQLFGDVTAILFIADSSSFDQTLREDRSKNRLMDSLEVFCQAWMNRYLQNVPILIFINKIDMLNDKIKTGHSIEYMLEDIKKISIYKQSLSAAGSRRSSDQRHCDLHLKDSTFVRDNNHLWPDSQFNDDNYDRKMSVRTVPAYGGNETCKDNNFDFVSETVLEYPWNDYEPTNEERKEFINSFPIDHNETSNSQIHHKKNKSKDTTHIHPETIRTACYVRNLFMQIIKKRPKLLNLKLGRRRKCLFYYTCAINTNNIENVLEGCRSFLMEDHLERFGIM